ncbi:MAG TPA: multidrug effflux MFS transporter [Pseudonocardia sp.]|uniref:multidrug effflux MFS transporter n=1 Tax=Pseudonocardia sp. TaxID=60912 RepID=UPI002B4B83A1|nr:multidrug effflux MFS transporter [Pseudonocardia sp.]HLU60108.1 multidrug effflux MFS transporter [Pseudonocardia sp.]
MSLAARAPLGVWICVLALLTAIAPLATDMYLPALPQVAAELGTTASGVQTTLTGFLVGLAAGQLVIGPLSDAWGRRRLLLAGTALCLVATAACVVAPTVGALVVARFLQGFGGAAGIVLSRAVIVDRTTGSRTVRLFSLMMAINGIAPVAAPLMGSGLLGLGSWRAIFVALTGLTLLMVIGAFLAIAETLPPERRVRGGLRATARDVRSALSRPRYVGFTLAFAFAFATLFTYISGSPFALQETLGLSDRAFAAAFGTNAAGLILASVANARLAGRVDPRRVLAVATTALVLLSLALLGIVLAGPSTGPVLVVLFLAVTSLGFVMGNASALASREVRDIAGTGSALLGALQFALGAAVSPLVGSSPLVMAVVMVVASVLSLGAQAALARRREEAPVPA